MQPNAFLLANFKRLINEIYSNLYTNKRIRVNECEMVRVWWFFQTHEREKSAFSNFLKAPSIPIHYYNHNR